MNRRLRILATAAFLCIGLFLLLRKEPKPAMGYFCVTYVDAYGGETPCIPQQMAIPGTFNPQDSAPKGAVAFSIYVTQ